jgi:hypothetical protein
MKRKLFTIDFTDMRPPVVTNFVVVENGLEIDTVVTSAGGKQGVLALGKRREESLLSVAPLTTKPGSPVFENQGSA